MNCAQVLIEGIKAMGARTHLLYPMAFLPCRKPLTFLSAANFGAMGFRLERVEEISGILREALAAPGPSVVDTIIDPDDLPPLNLEATLRMSMS